MGAFPAVSLCRNAETWHVDTPVGKIEAKLSVPLGEKATAIVLLIHGMSAQPEIVFEWTFLMEGLRRRKVAAVLPNLHSCEATAPASGSPADAVVALEAIAGWMQETTGPAPLFVYGKSWGGARAVELCQQLREHGRPPSGICLACPAPPGEALQGLGIPALLAWAEDDAVIPFAEHELLLQALRREDERSIFVPVQVGGHRIDKMAESDERLAAKLDEWPDLVLGRTRSRRTRAARDEDADRSSLRLVEAGQRLWAKAAGDQEAGARTSRRREELPPLRRGRAKAYAEPQAEALGPPTRSAPSRLPRRADSKDAAYEGDPLTRAPTRAQSSALTEERPPLPRAGKANKGLPRPPSDGHLGAREARGKPGNGLARPERAMSSRHRSRSMHRPTRRPASSKGELHQEARRPPNTRNAAASHAAPPSRDRSRSLRSHKWPASGGEMKVLLPNQVAEDLHQDGVLKDIASKSKASVDLMEAVGELHQFVEGHRLLIIRGQTGSELQAAVEDLLGKARLNGRAHGPGGSKLKILLPRHLAAVVIGRRGANIKDLQRTTGTSVQVENGSTGMDRVATVCGSPAAILNALGRIHSFGTEDEEGAGSDGPDSHDRPYGGHDNPFHSRPGDHSGLYRHDGPDDRDSRHGVDDPDGPQAERDGRPCSDEEESLEDGRRKKRKPPPKPAAPWEVREHPEAPGEFYYLNMETGDTTWERPAGNDAKPSAPPPWRVLEHPEAPGEFYYLNEDTGETCWDLPEGVILLKRTCSKCPSVVFCKTSPFSTCVRSHGHALKRIAGKASSKACSQAALARISLLLGLRLLYRFMSCTAHPL
eukprot:s3419_g3.t5